MPWMTDLYNNAVGFNARPLHQITIPGTHDAGCYVDHLYGNFQSRTQTQTIGQQLAGGIRYFDLRPYQANYVTGRSFWTFHGPFYTGGQIDGPNGILAQITNFMANLAPGDRELVILNFSHFNLKLNFSNADHQALINTITLALGNHLVPYTQAQINLFDAPYWQLLSNPAVGGGPPGVMGATPQSSRVAILYDGALDQNLEGYVTANVNALPPGFFVISPKYAPAANPIFLFDQYSATGSLNILRANQIDKLLNRANYPYSTKAWAAAAGNWPPNAAGGVASTLHLFSWTLTPQPYGDPIPAAANTSNPALPGIFSVGTRVIDSAGSPHPCSGVDQWAAWNYDPANDPKINILYVDHYTSHSYSNPASPLNGVPIPVAFAARLNAGPIWPMTW